MILHLIRHAQSSNNVLGFGRDFEERRTEDPELSEIGKQQIVHVGRFVAEQSWGIDRIYTSYMSRAIETACAIGEASKLPVLARLDIFENGGIWKGDRDLKREGLPGPSTNELRGRYPNVQFPQGENEDLGWWNRPFETLVESRRRVAGFIDSLIKSEFGEDEHVAMVTHGAFINGLLATFFETAEDVSPALWFDVKNVSITTLRHFAGREKRSFELDYLSSEAFLPQELVT